MNPRKSPRFVVELPVSFTGDHAGAGMVTNVSISGCDMETANVAMEANAMLTLHLYFFSKDVPVQIDAARVVWQRGHRCGLEFLSIDPKEHEALLRYIAEVSRLSSGADGGFTNVLPVNHEDSPKNCG